MIEKYMVIVFGIISGIFTALGMGGGTILILLFGIFTNIEQHLIHGVNLIFFIPTSCVAIYMNNKMHLINYDISKIIILGGIFGAIIGSKIAFFIDSKSLKKYLGFFLLIIAILEIYSFYKEYRLNQKENNK